MRDGKPGLVCGQKSRAQEEVLKRYIVRKVNGEWKLRRKGYGFNRDTEQGFTSAEAAWNQIDREQGNLGSAGPIITGSSVYTEPRIYGRRCMIRASAGPDHAP